MSRKLICVLIGLFFCGTLFGYTPVETVLQFNHCVGCYLKRANFSSLDLTGADLHNADLSYADFHSATLYKVNFNGANLTGAKFNGALWTDGVTVCKPGSIGRCVKKTQ